MSSDLLNLATTLVVLIVCFAAEGSAATTSEPVNCDSVKYSFSEKPLNEDYQKEAFSE